MFEPDRVIDDWTSNGAEFSRSEPPLVLRRWPFTDCAKATFPALGVHALLANCVAVHLARAFCATQLPNLVDGQAVARFQGPLVGIELGLVVVDTVLFKAVLCGDAERKVSNVDFKSRGFSRLDGLSDVRGHVRHFDLEVDRIEAVPGSKWVELNQVPDCGGALLREPFGHLREDLVVVDLKCCVETCRALHQAEVCGQALEAAFSVSFSVDDGFVVRVTETVQADQPVVESSIFQGTDFSLIAVLTVCDDRRAQTNICAVFHDLFELWINRGLTPTDVTGFQAVYPSKSIGDHHDGVDIEEHQVGLVGVVAKLAGFIAGAAVFAQEQPAPVGGLIVRSIDRTCCLGGRPGLPKAWPCLTSGSAATVALT